MVNWRRAITLSQNIYFLIARDCHQQQFCLFPFLVNQKIMTSDADCQVVMFMSSPGCQSQREDNRGEELSPKDCLLLGLKITGYQFIRPIIAWNRRTDFTLLCTEASCMGLKDLLVV